MKTYLLPLSLLAFTAASVPLAAQTPAAKPPVHHTATAAHHAEGGCVRLPEVSPKVPALPAGLSCARALYTLTRTPDIKLDYVSPLVGPAVRDILSTAPTTFSLDYVDTKVGTGELAQPHKWYTVHYTGYLADGTKFDSSVDRGEPISFPYGQHKVIEGWDTGFEGMHIGGKRRLYVPFQLAYGEAGRPPVIPARAGLVFDLELIAQSDEQPKPKTPPTPPAGARPGVGGIRREGPPATSSPATPPASTPATKPDTPINSTTPNAAPPSPKQ